MKTKTEEIKKMKNTFEELGRQKLIELLSKLPEDWVGVFNRMYGSVNTIPLEKIDWAIQQCERSIEKLKEKKEEEEEQRESNYDDFIDPLGLRH